jgi:hypothetical protein
MPNQTRHYMVSIDEKINATRWGTHDSHKCYNWSQNLSCYEGKIFKNEGGKNQLSFHLEKLDVIKYMMHH